MEEILLVARENMISEKTFTDEFSARSGRRFCADITGTIHMLDSPRYIFSYSSNTVAHVFLPRIILL